MMRYHPLEFVLLAFLLMTNFAASDIRLENSGESPEVTIPQGTLLGKYMTTCLQNRGISAFLGIPYAQPPIGNLRFANPVAAGRWNGTLNASIDSNMCSQISQHEVLGEEDCLYINVYTPQLPDNTTSSPLPVMVFIHGGAFQTGSQGSTKLGPGYLLDEDIVLVTLNYRLGPIGFLSTGDEVASGNWGLKDQVLALEWVQKNIEYFDGDPDQVTLFGESAGAAAVHLLSLSNSTIGLFHKYITQSGSALATWAHQPRAPYSRRAFELGNYVGCSNDTTDSLISCLRAIDVSDIIATKSRFLKWQIYPDIVWGPTDEPLDIENAFLTDSPTNLFAAGKIRDLPWINGIVRDEGLLQTTMLCESEEILDDFMEKFDLIVPQMMSFTHQPDSGASWIKAMRSYYLTNDLSINKTSFSDKNSTSLLSNLTRLITDSHFAYPAYNSLKKQNVLAKSPQYFYTFNYRGVFSHTYLYKPGSMVNYGVSHADDLTYIFPPDSRFQNLNLTPSENDLEMVRVMTQLWTSFAINGTPMASTSNGIFVWDAYSATEDNYLRIGDESSVELEIQYSFLKDRMQFWDDINDRIFVRSGATNISPSLIFGLIVFFNKCSSSL